MGVSACLVVRDEEQSLPHTLKSLVGKVDEVVVAVDNRTTDRTIDVAKAAGAKTFMVTWSQCSTCHADDFSSARNLAIEQCTQDWILTIDADETLVADSLGFLDKVPSGFDLVLVPVSMRSGEVESARFLGERLFRRKPDIRYVGVVHHYVNAAGNARTSTNQVVIYHDKGHQPEVRTEARSTQRQRDCIAHLTHMSEGDPTDTRSRFYLANTLYSGRNWTEAVKWFVDHINKAQNSYERYQSAVYCVRVLTHLDRKDEAVQMACQGLPWDTRRAELAQMLGDLLYGREDYAAARDFYTMASAKSYHDSFFWLEPDCYGYMPWLGLTLAYHHLNLPYESLRCAARAHQIKPDMPLLRQNLERCRATVTTAEEPPQPAPSVVTPVQASGAKIWAA